MGSLDALFHQSTYSSMRMSGTGTLGHVCISCWVILPCAKVCHVKKLCQGCSKKCGGQCCPILQQLDRGRAQTTNGVQERVLRLPNWVQQFNRGQGRRVHGGSV